jgi:hypothetical protein
VANKTRSRAHARRVDEPQRHELHEIFTKIISCHFMVKRFCATRFAVARRARWPASAPTVFTHRKAGQVVASGTFASRVVCGFAREHREGQAEDSVKPAIREKNDIFDGGHLAGPLHRHDSAAEQGKETNAECDYRNDDRGGFMVALTGKRSEHQAHQDGRELETQPDPIQVLGCGQSYELEGAKDNAQQEEQVSKCNSYGHKFSPG